MKNHKASLSKIRLLILVTTVGIAAISTTGAVMAETSSFNDFDTIQSSEKNPDWMDPDQDFDEQDFDDDFDPENDPFLAELLEEALSEMDDGDLDEWNEAGEPDFFVEEDTAIITSPSLDEQLLPVNDYVYLRNRTRTVGIEEVAASVVNGGLWEKSGSNRPGKPTGMKIKKKPQSIASGHGSVVPKSKARVKDTPQFGIAADEDNEPNAPFSADDLDHQSRENIFLAWQSCSQNEPSFYGLDDEVDPFDEEVQAVNDTVFGTQKKQRDDTLIAQADEPETAPALQENNRQEEESDAPSLAETPENGQQISPPVQPAEEVDREETGYLVRFTDVRMQEYLGFISEITGKNFIFDPADLDFRVTIVSNEPTSLSNVMVVLLQELRFRGLDMVEVGNNIIIHKDSGKSSPAHVVGEGGEIPKNVEIVTQVYRLKNTNPGIMASIIRPMLSSSAAIESISDSGHLIVTGLKSNIQRITDLIENIDSPEAGIEIGQYQARNLPISQAISIAENILAPMVRDMTFVMVPLSRKNLVYIVTTPNLLAQAISVFSRIDSDEELPRTEFDVDATGRRIVDETDFEARARVSRHMPVGSLDVTKFYIHKLQYRKGDQIQQALRAIAQSLEDIQVEIENYNFIATIDSVQWIQSTNSLIFTGTAETLAKMRELIDELDTSVAQVLIEILVIEATVDDSLTFGVDWGSRFGSPTIAGGQGFLQENSPLSAALDSGVPGLNLDPSGLARQAGFNLGVIGRAVSRGGCDFNTMGALVRALHTDRRIDVLLNPKIVVEDNATAEFFVGINTPFQTQSIANDLGTIITGNFEFRDVGSTIKITPLIGNNGIITLDIEQEISSATQSNFIGGGTTSPGTGGGGTTAGGGAGGDGIQDSISSTAATTNIGPTTRRSTTKTRVHMPDGYFLILSGQIRDEKEEIRTQVPCLGGVPWLGAFFSSKQNNITKNNLMIFIRPQIVDIERINPITKRQQDIWNERKRLPKRWEYEVDEALQWFNVKEPYCAPEMRKLRE